MSKCCALAFHQSSVVISDNNESALLLSVALGNELSQCVNQQGLRGRRAVVILGASDYQLLRIKKPDVPVNEVLTAILWQEQSKFSLPIDQLVVDYVESPNMSNEKRIYIVAAAKRALKERYQELRDKRLQPVKITVPEFIYGHYIQRYYSNAATVIWVNYFNDTAQVFAFHQGELIATLKLPKVEASIMSEACLTALNLFYLAEIKLFTESPLWLMNGNFSIEAAMLNQLSGKVQWLNTDTNSYYYKTAERLNHSAVSHAYYGMLANE